MSPVEFQRYTKSCVLFPFSCASLRSMSYVGFKKTSYRPVDFNCQGPPVELGWDEIGDL